MLNAAAPSGPIRPMNAPYRAPTVATSAAMIAGTFSADALGIRPADEASPGSSVNVARLDAVAVAARPAATAKSAPKPGPNAANCAAFPWNGPTSGTTNVATPRPSMARTFHMPATPTPIAAPAASHSAGRSNATT